MVAPHTGNFIDERLGDMTIGKYHGKRKIRAHKAVSERQKCQHHKDKLRQRGATRQWQGQSRIALHQIRRRDCLHQRYGQCQHQYKMAELGNHGAPFAGCGALYLPDFSKASATSGGI
ncbi:MAG: Uncharacterised protein [Alphaproteobacteria bacterium]|nr:MAG: Uncharacterised protein [Alphaproteobacteria bacterium]